MSRSITILSSGLETCVQELPGRVGFLGQGFPVSGPFDAWSFRQANLLVGNDRETAALECQLMGATIRFGSDARVAVTGANMTPTLDGEIVPMWQTLSVRADQVLALSTAAVGMRTYIAISGGIATESVLGSRAVLHMANIGGRALVNGDILELGTSKTVAKRDAILTVLEEHRPVFSVDRRWSVEVMAGPNDDWLSEESIEMFFSTDWTVRPMSNRTGIRLSGPEFSFAERAYNKSSDHGQDPSNIIDHGYPAGAVNLAGQTPIILGVDGPTAGGFINPFVVVSAAFWKLAQVQPNEVLYFTLVDHDEAANLRADLDAATRDTILTRV